MIHPLLFSIFPIIALYHYNIKQLALAELWLPLGLVFGVACISLLVSALVLRNAAKGALILTLCIALFFSFGHILAFIHIPHAPMILLAVWVVLFLVGFILTIRTRRNLRNLTIILNTVAVAMLAIPSIGILIYEIRRSPIDVWHETYANITATTELPDIYYIVLDTYPSASTLSEFYGFDNSDFLDNLTDEGFYIASNSRANEVGTWFSLASSMNMEMVGLEENKNSTNLASIVTLLQDSQVVNFLKGAGYAYVHLGSRWTQDRYNEYADIDLIPSVPTKFRSVLWGTTMLPLIPDKYVPAIGINAAQYKAALDQFKTLSEVPNKIQSPKFVFAHMILPHTPLVFDENGNFLEDTPKPEEEAPRFLDQITYCNKRVAGIIDLILAQSPDAVIILQGDHGPLWLTHNLELTEAEGDRMYLRILNAYHVPSDMPLYDSITPVNTFRVIFNYYFGTNYELLPDKSFTTRDWDKPFDFTEVAP